MVSGIVPDSQRQKGVYDQADRFRETQLMLLMDELNTKMGRFTLRSAAMGDGSSGATSQQYLSKLYTTQWDELLEVYASWPGETKSQSRKQRRVKTTEEALCCELVGRPVYNKK